MLASTGLLGDPTEYFDDVTLKRRGVTDYPDDPEAQLAAIPRLGATPNGVYGLKIFSRHFDAVRHTRWAERLPALSFIHLTRLDVVGQAISQVRAAQTQQWTSRSPATAHPAYDFAAIDAEFLRLINSQARWAYYLGRNGVPVLHIVYEQLMMRPKETVDAIARFIGLSDAVTVDFTKVTVTIQRDDLTAEWRQRFISQARDLKQFR